MKIAIILGAFSIGTRPLDFNSIWTSNRGLTGTDLCFVQISKELYNLGHDVSMFTVHSDSCNIWEGIKLYDFNDRFNIVDDTFDFIVSINEPNILFNMNRKPKRIVWQMLNDFSFIQPGFDEQVDKYLGVCEEHTSHMMKQTPIPSKWSTLHLGCNPDWYSDKRVEGRVIWCSSADRGLHWLLSEWQKIKSAVPSANLRIFYHFSYNSIETIEDGTDSHPHVIEMAQRIRYMKYAIDKLKDSGVSHIGSISRERMKQEFSEASCFAFPCDTVAFSEGFSVSTLEAHASHTVPVITDVDCLGGIYKNSGCVMINGHVGAKLNDFSTSVIKALTDKEFADARIEQCMRFANSNTWTNSAKKLETIMKEML